MIKFHCPRCNRVMTLTDDQRGEYAFCKFCDGRVWIPADAPLSQTKVHSQEAEARDEGSPPPPATFPSSGDQPSMRPEQIPDLPTSKSKSASIPEPPNPATASSTPPVHHPIKNKPRERFGTSDVYSPLQTPPPHPPEAQPPQNSSRHHATLITAEPAQSPLAAAADGQLPELSLESDNRNDTKQSTSLESNRWLTLVVVCVSLLFSTILLLLETESSVDTQTRTKDQILMRIQEKYFGPENGPWPRYQRYLRDAALARSQGDYQKEERYYRKVLHLLNAQHLDKTDQGVTGLRRRSSDSSLKSDEELMGLLSALLTNNKN